MRSTLSHSMLVSSLVSTWLLALSACEPASDDDPRAMNGTLDASAAPPSDVDASTMQPVDHSECACHA